MNHKVNRTLVRHKKGTVAYVQNISTITGGLSKTNLSLNS